uniref:Photosystem I reaction center subunit VIII n=1 Tax=Bornetia secundiflora TaxID=2575637 RepID=A0A4D6WQR9_9FLOR|nr:photosystem I reaction center subunit VIII [Bornetia secundiflora]
MTASYLPSILVPLTGIIFPGLSMALLFIYIENENIS